MGIAEACACAQRLFVGDLELREPVDGKTNLFGWAGREKKEIDETEEGRTRRR